MVVFGKLLLILASMVWTCSTAHAQSDSQSASTAPWSSLFPDVDLPSNVTASLPSTLSSTGIFCYEYMPGRETTYIDGCRPTLNSLRSFPRYRTVQYFQEGRYPKEPSKPPYLLHTNDSTCALQISCGTAGITDKFSFEQARALATDIVEDCQKQGGYGGVARIGRGIGWSVKVIGYRTLDVRKPESITLGRSL